MGDIGVDQFVPEVPDRNAIKQRVDDWLKRLALLKAQLIAWVKDDKALSHLEPIDLPSVSFSEELMQRVGLPAQQAPAFEFRSGNRRVMRVQPKGLWVIGANGRVDLVTKNAAPILVDKSEPLAPSSSWQLYDPRTREGPVPLRADTFKALLNDALK